MIKLNLKTNHYYHIPLNKGGAMKLKDCDCGAIAQVTYNINDNSEYFVSCTVCDNQTPAFRSLREAVSQWNQIYCCALPPYEIESV
jgi:hypothetical protein